MASSAGCGRDTSGGPLKAIPLTATFRVVASVLVWVMFPLEVPLEARKKRT
jgi:hypothetical protein